MTRANGAAEPVEPVTAVCAAMYYADPVSAYAFVFRVTATGTRFTVYAAEQDRWLINGTYVLTISEPDQMPLWLSTDEAAFLRHCLGLVEQRWQDAITEAEAGARRPPAAEPPSPGHLDIEPTPAGYRTIAARFREELSRVNELTRRLDQLHPAAPPDTETNTATDAATDAVGGAL